MYLAPSGIHLVDRPKVSSLNGTPCLFPLDALGYFPIDVGVTVAQPKAEAEVVPGWQALGRVASTLPPSVPSRKCLYVWPCSKAVEDYRSPRRSALQESLAKSARFWTAPVLWRFGFPTVRAFLRHHTRALPHYR